MFNRRTFLGGSIAVGLLAAVPDLIGQESIHVDFTVEELEGSFPSWVSITGSCQDNGMVHTIILASSPNDPTAIEITKKMMIEHAIELKGQAYHFRNV